MFNASLLMTYFIYIIVILRFVGTGFGYFIFKIFLRSASNSSGKKFFFNIFIFYSLVATLSSSIKIKILIKVVLRYLLTF